MGSSININNSNTVDIAVRTARRTLGISSWNKTSLNHFKGTPSKWKEQRHVNISIKDEPLKNYNIFPSQDPYTGTQRGQFRALNENISWINRANKLMVFLIAGTGFTTSVEPRDLKHDIVDEELENWANDEKSRVDVPYFTEMNGEETKMTPQEIKEWTDLHLQKLDYPHHLQRALRYMREQGQGCIAMFPETKFKNTETGEVFFEMPRILRTIRPEHQVKVWLDLETGELDSVQTIGLASNGGRLSSKRMVWMTEDFNLELNSDFYGESKILPLVDIGVVMGILYGKDFIEAALYTWHQPKIFKVTIPPRDFKSVSKVLRSFLSKNNNSAGRDIAVTQAVELISNGSNTGDLKGLIELDDHLIDQVAGFYNIPPFLLSKGKAGNLGGNAQKEEVDGFLNFEVKPQQEIVETHNERQLYDRILQILFKTDDIDAVPIKINLNLNKPDLETLIDKDQYEILINMEERGIISEDGLVERLGVENLQDGSISAGGDTTPGEATWKGPGIKRRWMNGKKLKWGSQWGSSKSKRKFNRASPTVWSNSNNWQQQEEQKPKFKNQAITN